MLSFRYQIFILHSGMQTLDQKKAMKTSPPGVRKIVSETSGPFSCVIQQSFTHLLGRVEDTQFSTFYKTYFVKIDIFCKLNATHQLNQVNVLLILTSAIQNFLTFTPVHSIIKLLLPHSQKHLGFNPLVARCLIVWKLECSYHARKGFSLAYFDRKK